MENTSKKVFIIPLWVGWLINILSWILFLSSNKDEIEYLAGGLCLIAMFIGIKHKNYKLIITSILESLWMFSFGADAIDEDVASDLFKSIKRMF
jgi:hypothetical protein